MASRRGVLLERISGVGMRGLPLGGGGGGPALLRGGPMARHPAPACLRKPAPTHPRAVGNRSRQCHGGSRCLPARPAHAARLGPAQRADAGEPRGRGAAASCRVLGGLPHRARDRRGEALRLAVPGQAYHAAPGPGSGGSAVEGKGPTPAPLPCATSPFPRGRSASSFADTVRRTACSPQSHLPHAHPPRSTTRTWCSR